MLDVTSITGGSAKLPHFFGPAETLALEYLADSCQRQDIASWIASIRGRSHWLRLSLFSLFGFSAG